MYTADNSGLSSTQSIEYKVDKQNVRLNTQKLENRYSNFFVDDDREEYDNFKKSLQKAIPSQNRYYCDDVYQYCKICGQQGHSKKFCIQQKSSQCMIYVLVQLASNVMKWVTQPDFASFNQIKYITFQTINQEILKC
ncbi:hypothetical protein pb186bvf_011279 [Paramecium bursaria]